MKARFLIVVLVSLGAFSAPVFGQGAELVYIEVRDIETDSVLHSEHVPYSVLNYLATGIYYTYAGAAYLIEINRPIENNTNSQKNRTGYIFPSFKKSNMINKVTLIGRVGKDPETRTLESGQTVSNFSIATDEGYKDKANEWIDKTEWHSVVCWRATAERAERSIKKGLLVYVEGKISTRKWQDKEGNDRYMTDIVANYFRVLEKKDSGVSNTERTEAKPTAQPVPAGGNDDDLPF